MLACLLFSFHFYMSNSFLSLTLSFHFLSFFYSFQFSVQISHLQIHLYTISCSCQCPRFLIAFNSPRLLFFLINKKCLLRWQGIFDLHVGNVIVEGNGNHLFHGANEAVLFTPIFNDQGVRLVRVKHDVVRRDNHDASDHTLQEKMGRTKSTTSRNATTTALMNSCCFSIDFGEP